MVIRKSISFHGILPNPYTLVGSADWQNYSASVDARVGGKREVALLGRIDVADVFKDGKHIGQALIFYKSFGVSDGSRPVQSYKAPTVKLASGKIRTRSTKWHRLELVFRGSVIEVSIDGMTVAKLTNTTPSHGMAGLGSGWNKAQFNNFIVL